MRLTMNRRTAIWLAAVPFVVLAALGHWIYWYQPRLRTAVPVDDLPAEILRAEGFDTAVWIAHPHQNLPALADMTGLDAPGLAAALRLAGVTGADAPRLGRVRIPPASSLAVAASRDGERVVAAARLHPLAAGFLRLAGRLASNPWLEGGRVGGEGLGYGVAGITVAWRGATWTAATDPAHLEDLAGSAVPEQLTPAVAWIRQGWAPGAQGDPGVLPPGTLALLAAEGSIRLASRPLPIAASPESPGVSRLEQGRRVLDAGEALLVLVRGRSPGSASSEQTEQTMLLLPLPHGTDVSELPRSAVLHRPHDGAHAAAHAAAHGAGAKPWKLPGEQLLEIAGHDLPRGAAAGWQVRASDAVALGSALAAAPELRTLADAGPDRGLPTWALWLDVGPASVEVDRLARGLEQSPFLRRSDRLRWHDAAVVLRSMARRPARVEGFVDGEQVLFRWVVATSPSG